MADGFDIHLDEELAQKLAKAAERVGMTPAEYAHDILGMALADWDEDDATGFEEYDRTGESIPFAEAWAEFEAGLEAALVARGK